MTINSSLIEILYYSVPSSFDTSKFLVSGESEGFYQGLGESLWLDSNIFQKIWGYLHLRADFSSYHKTSYYVDRGCNFVEKNDSKKIMPLFLKIIAQSDLEEKVINGMIDSVEIDKFFETIDLKNEDENKFLAGFQVKLFYLLSKHYIEINPYKQLINEFTKRVVDSYQTERSTEKIKPLLFDFISKIFELEKIKNELSISSNLFAAFVIKSVSFILSDDFSSKDLKESISKKIKKLNDRFYKDTAVNEEELKEVDEMLDGGQCLGLTLSLFLQDSSSYNPEQAFKRAKFLQPMQEIGNLFQPSHLRVGKILVDNPSISHPILEKVCEILNYKKEDGSIDLDAFFEEVRSKEGLSDGIYQLIGAMAQNMLGKARSKMHWIDLPDYLAGIEPFMKNNTHGQEHILKFLKLDETKIFEAESISSMVNLLYSLFLNYDKTKLPSKFGLSLRQMNHEKPESEIGHSIFISLDPIGYLDQNNIDYKNIKLRFRQFDSIEDMLIDLMYITEVIYKDIFNGFHLSSFKKAPVHNKI